MSGIEDEIKQHALDAFPHEACGLLLDIGKKRPLVMRCRNISRDPENSFIVAPADYAQAYRISKGIIGIWHSHPKTSNQPSPADLYACELSQKPWYIMAVRKNGENTWASDLNVIKPSGFEMPYEGRPYIEGVFDCFGLLRDYYRREFDITISDYPRIEDDGTMGYTRFMERYEKEGFYRLPEGTEPIKGDVFLMQLFEAVVNHIAVYIGNEQILHHNRDRLSRREVWGGYWKKCATIHLRHKTLC